MSEMLHLAQSNASLARTVIVLFCGMGILLAGMFLLAFVAASLAQTTESQGDALLIKGTKLIAATAAATVQIPLSFSALLDSSSLQRITNLAVSNIFPPMAAAGSAPVGITYVMNIQSAIKYNSTLVKFWGNGGEIITIDRGVIYLYNSKLFPGQTAQACGSSTCSALDVTGVDVSAMKTQAAQLGYPAYMGRRSTMMYNCPTYMSGGSGSGSGSGSGKGAGDYANMIGMGKNSGSSVPKTFDSTFTLTASSPLTWTAAKLDDVKDELAKGIQACGLTGMTECNKNNVVLICTTLSAGGADCTATFIGLKGAAEVGKIKADVDTMLAKPASDSGSLAKKLITKDSSAFSALTGNAKTFDATASILLDGVRPNQVDSAASYVIMKEAIAALAGYKCGTNGATLCDKADIELLAVQCKDKTKTGGDCEQKTDIKYEIKLAYTGVASASSTQKAAQKDNKVKTVKDMMGAKSPDTVKNMFKTKAGSSSPLFAVSGAASSADVAMVFPSA